MLTADNVAASERIHLKAAGPEMGLMKAKVSLLVLAARLTSHSILFYSILFYSILFYSILFYSILFYSILFYSACPSRIKAGQVPSRLAAGMVGSNLECPFDKWIQPLAKFAGSHCDVKLHPCRVGMVCHPQGCLSSPCSICECIAVCR